MPGATASNSREALDASARKGFSLIEVDLVTTRSGEIILLRGWDKGYVRYFSRFPRLPKRFRSLRDPQAETAEEFISWKMREGLTQLALPDLLDWMAAHPEVKIVTDVKGDNLLVLQRVAELAGQERMPQFIPQIYSPEELEPVKGLGFGAVVLTGYRSDLPLEELVSFVETQNIFALTLPAAEIIKSQGTPFPDHVRLFAHTVNDPEVAEALSAYGVDGLYTDRLVPMSERAR